MNKREKLVQQEFLNNEEAVIRKLKNQYSHALKEINSKSKALQDQINSLQGTMDVVTDEAAKAQLQSMIQSKVYQKQYQDALKKQIGSILDNMQVEEFKTVSEYLQQCYEDGFIGAMYDLQGQGIPLCFPMDQETMVRAIQLDSKISQGLYSRLGEDVAVLKKKITAQISRGISTGMSFSQVAEQLKRISNIGFNNAVRIARTEGHRIQIQSAMDACYKAKDKGADVVKQWDSTLDKRTRRSHQKVDGEIRELDEPFSNGLMFPGDPSGGAGEVVNCRCALLQRARWALDEDELQTLKDRAAYFGLDKAKNFADYKNKYLKAAKQSARMEMEKFTPAKSIKEAEAFARDTLGLECSYKGVDLRCANDMNAAFKRGLDYCPSIKDRLKVVGSGQERNRRFKADMTAFYLEDLKKSYPGQPESWYNKYAKSFANRTVGRIDGRTYAFASGRKPTGNAIVDKYAGIVVNDKWGGNSETFINALKRDVDTKWHPIGCDTIASVFDHEVAHQIDYAVGLRDNKEMLDLWRSLSEKDISDGLSRYGSTKIAEFIAEGYAEYVNSSNPREISRKIGAIIEKAVKGS